MHEFTAEVEALAQEVLAYSLDRLKNDPPLDGPRSAEDLFAQVGNTITARVDSAVMRHLSSSPAF